MSGGPAEAGGVEAWKLGSTRWSIGSEGPLHASVLFVDLVSSTDLASVLPLEEYADFSRTFRNICLKQCRHFFEDYRSDKYEHDGRHYGFNLIGDELVVFLHTDKPHDDVYQLVCLAITLKCAWLGAPLNADRIRSGRPTFELAVGIHSGPVWAERLSDGFDLSGFAINLAKRTESVSREGERFRIFLTDPAFKLVNRRMRNLIFGPRHVVEMKGISSIIAVYELVDSFVDPTRRIYPEYGKAFEEIAERALATNTFDLWIHSCIQNAAGGQSEKLSEQSLSLCSRVLAFDPSNPVALYYSADAEHSRGNLETARLYLEDLTRHWPTFGDGWLELGRLQLELDDPVGARRSILQARRHGVADDEQVLPEVQSD